MFFFPLVLHPPDDDRWRFSSAYVASKPDIQWLEKTLMGMAFEQNPDLENVRDMTRLRSITVRGIMGPKRPGRQHADVALARQALLGVKRKRRIEPNAELAVPSTGGGRLAGTEADALTLE